MSLEMLICIIGFIVLTYFMAKPKPESKKEDKLTKEIHVRGLSSNPSGTDWLAGQ